MKPDLSSLNTLAIIPARGGSKGIPRKNLQTVGGMTLVGRSIHEALRSRSIRAAAVSTDDDEIAAEASRHGASIIRRPTEISGDRASSESALLHALDSIEASGNKLPDILVFLQCTSPLTLAEDIDNAVEKLISEEADACLTACRFHYFVWKNAGDGAAYGINHDKSVRLPRQQREPEFLENGAIYVMRVSGFRAAQHRFFGKTVLSEMPASRCFEIDEPADLAMAEALLRADSRAA